MTDEARARALLRGVAIAHQLCDGARYLAEGQRYCPACGAVYDPKKERVDRVDREVWFWNRQFVLGVSANRAIAKHWQLCDE